ncbi:MAG: RNA polymerase sigma factor [Siphonobacter sp.]
MKILSLFQTEEQLVKACQKADPKAQRRVYEKYASKMLAVCRRYFKDDYEAEEAMIEGFVKVFERIDQFKLEGSFEGWIRRIIVNECLMSIRSKKQQGWQMTYEEVLYEPEPQLPETSLETEDLMHLIDALPVGYRTVFNLYAIEGYSHEEIAHALHITESTSKSQLHRARALLQRMISELDSRQSIHF